MGAFFLFSGRRAVVATPIAGDAEDLALQLKHLRVLWEAGVWDGRDNAPSIDARIKLLRDVHAEMAAKSGDEAVPDYGRAQAMNA